MNRTPLSVVLLFGALVSAPCLAQVPDHYENLKVLPADIGKRELVAVMREFAGALGVLAGGMTVWFRQGRFRKQAREAKAEAAEARGRAEDMREKVDRMERASLAALPPSGRNAA